MEVEVITGVKERRSDDVTTLESGIRTDDVTREEREDSILV